MEKRDVASFTRLLDLDIVPDIDTADHALSRRAEIQVHGECLLCLASFSFWHFQMVTGPNLSNSKNIVYVLDISFHVCPIAVFRSGNLFSGQPRGQGSHHSGSRCRDDMIERRCMLLFRLDLVESLDPAMDAIIGGLTKSFDRRSPGWTLFPDNL